MAMSTGSRGGPAHDINVTPLIDVMLVLIIIFMVIQPLHPSGLNALVPQPNHEKKTQPADNRTIVVQILNGSPTNIVKINDQTVTWDTLGPQLESIYKTRAQKVMFVKGDDDIPFEYIAHAIDIAKGVDPSIMVGILTPKMEAGN